MDVKPWPPTGRKASQKALEQDLVTQGNVDETSTTAQHVQKAHDPQQLPIGSEESTITAS